MSDKNGLPDAHLLDRDGPDATNLGEFPTGAYRMRAKAELRTLYGLTAREAEVARCLAVGFSNDDIAKTLGISVHTVRRHVENVLRRLEIHRRSEVATKLLIRGD